MAEKKEKKAPAKKAAAAPKKVKKAAAAAAPSAGSTEPVTRKFQDFTIIKKRSGRFEVLSSNGKNVNGMDKAKVLLDAKLIKTGIGKAGAAPAASGEEAPPAAT